MRRRVPDPPGKRYVDWELDDPAGKGVETVRPIRDDIERRVRALLEELDVPPHPDVRYRLDSYSGSSGGSR